LDRKIEFSLPDNEGRTHILKIHGKRSAFSFRLEGWWTQLTDSMSVERDIRYELIARLCPNATGAELKSVATEVSYNRYLILIRS
jgi:26S proteasome regulatory subunit T1